MNRREWGPGGPERRPGPGGPMGPGRGPGMGVPPMGPTRRPPEPPPPPPPPENPLTRFLRNLTKPKRRGPWG